MDYKKVKVVSNIQIDDDIFVLTLDIGDDVKPGQFYMLRAWDIEPLLARPISVNFVEGRLVSFAYQVKGRGTKILSNLKAEDKVDVLGPVGNGIDFKNIKGRVALVLGGIGIAPLLYTAKLIEGKKVLYSGFSKKSYLIDNFKPYVDEIRIATDSGLEGHKGFVTDIFTPDEHDVVICCGPEIMMKKVVEMCREKM